MNKIINYIIRKISRLLENIKEKIVLSEIKKIAGLNVKKISTFTSESELLKLYEIAKGFPQKVCIVEIGSYLGASTLYIAAGLSKKDSTIFCIDTWKNETMPEGEKDTFEEFSLNTSKIKDKVIKIRKKSSEVLPEEIPQNINFAFIDGDHSYQNVKQDFLLISEKLSERSTLAFHDIIHYEGVSKVVGELLMSGNWRLEGQINNLVWLKKYKFKS